MSDRANKSTRCRVARAVIVLGTIALPPAISFGGPSAHRTAETAASTVTLSDLDLTSATGVSSARDRISAIAWRLCKRFENSALVDHRETTLECYREAVSAALERVTLSARVARVSSSKENSDSKR